MSRLQAGRPEAAEVIWRWRERERRGALEPSAARARITGTLQGLIGASVGLALRAVVSPSVGAVVIGISSIVLLAALASPRGLYRAIEAAFAALGRFTGRVLTWLLLVPLFYLFFLPFGLLLRRGRRDRMKRFFAPDAASYWEPHDAIRAADHERQF